MTRIASFVSSCLLVLGGIVGGGCAVTTSSSGPSSPTFDVEPEAPTPRLSVTWRRELDLPESFDFRSRQYAVPVVDRRRDQRDVVVATESGTVSELRAGDGRVRWRRDVDEPVRMAPSVSRRRVFVGTTAGSLIGFDRQSGTEEWQRNFSYGLESPMAVGGNRLYYVTLDGNLHASSAETGDDVWTYERQAPEEFTVMGAGGPTYIDGTVFCGFADGRLLALDGETGERYWRADLSGGEAEYADIVEPAVVREARVYAASYSGGVYLLRRSSGAVIWSRSISNVADIAVGEERIYVAVATGRVVALDADSGESLWGFQFEDNLPSALNVADDYVFASTGGGPLYVLDRATGFPLKRWQPSSGFSTRAVFSKRAGYVLSNRGYLYNFRLAKLPESREFFDFL